MLNKFSGLMILIVFGAVFSICYAASTSEECNDCETSAACSGVKMDGTKILGCKEKLIGDDCTGTCQKCKNGTATDFCKFTGNSSDTCVSNSGTTVDCGDTYELSCSGSTYPNCSCGGTETYKDNSCKMSFCS